MSMSNLVSKLAACHQHQRELVQCHKMCLPDLQSLCTQTESSSPPHKLSLCATWHSPCSPSALQIVPRMLLIMRTMQMTVFHCGQLPPWRSTWQPGTPTPAVGLQCSPLLSLTCLAKLLLMLVTSDVHPSPYKQGNKTVIAARTTWIALEPSALRK